MTPKEIIDQLEKNKLIFQQLLEGQAQAAYSWRPFAEHWCLMEIVCHLYDEEQEDFRQRVKTTLENPGTLPPPIDPTNWVEERAYSARNYEVMVHKFLEERTASIAWLKSLKNPNWSNSYQHPELGELSARHFVSTWLAHDYLHLRQIIRLKYQYLAATGEEDLAYAGNW